MTPEQEKLVTNHLGMVTVSIKPYLGVSGKVPLLQQDEVVAEARLALVKAALRYNPSKKVKFGTYAHIVIKGHIQDYLRKYDDLSRRDRRKPKPTITAQRGGVAKEERWVTHLNKKGKLVEHEQYHTNTPEKQLCAKEVRGLVNKILHKHPRNRKVLIAMYVNEQSCGEVGAKLGMCGSNVSHINKKTMTLLRKGFEKRGITSSRQLL